MKKARLPRRGTYRPLQLLLLLAPVALAGCAGASSDPDEAAPVPDAATEAEWRALATPRPEPLDGAPRVGLATVEILSTPSWTLPAGMSPGTAVTELAAAALLERRDVRFVERRRFARAAEAERRGEPRPSGAPPAGVSPGAELLGAGTWVAPGTGSAWLELRLTDVATGGVVATGRTETAVDADPVALARALVASLEEALAEGGRLPAVAAPRPPEGVPPPTATAAFLRGLAAEERWSWEEARRSYRSALEGAGAFPEARAALARTARLRTGGTLGAS